MTLMKITLNLAFEDAEAASLDAVRGTIANDLVEIGAEVLFTSDAKQWACPVADVDYSADDYQKQSVDWQERARAELS